MALLACLVLLVPLLAACGSGGGATTAPTAATGGGAPVATEATGGATAPTAATGGGATAPTEATGGGTTAPTEATGGATAPTAATGGTSGQAQPGTGPADAANLAPADQQVLRVQLQSEPASIDPAQDQDTSQETVIKQLFTGLTRMTADLKPESAIADSWKFNADNTQVTFSLKDTKWSDGQPVTAKDFEYAWKRFIDPRTASPYASLVLGVIKGATELNTASISDTAKLQTLVDGLGVKAVDDKTLQVDLAQPAPYFPYIAALGNMGPVRKDIVEKDPATWAEVGSLIGNGPFVLKSWAKGTEIVLTPNPNYYEGPPKLQTLTIKFITDNAAAFANYQADEVDIVQVPSPEIPGIRANPQFDGQVTLTSRLATYFYGFDATKPPFNNVKVRQAFAAAIDRKTLNDQVLNGVNIPAYSFIPPGMPAHLTQEEAGDTQVFNPEKAKALLAEAGYPDGKGFPTITLAYNTTSDHALIAQRLQADLQSSLGIQVALDPRDPKTYFGDIQKNPPPFFRSGWNADYPDPADWDRLVFGPGSDQNYGKWENPDYTKLLDQADKESDPTKREAIYKQAEKILAQDAGALFIYWYGNFRLVKPWVKNLTYTAQDPELGAYSYKDAQILNH
jgi:oligopeptide transport system substrate-binding protein